MRRPIVLFSGWLTAALLVLGPAAPGADDTARREPVEVVLKSLDTKLRVDGRVIDSRGMFLRFRVDTVQGDWLWLVANEGIRGWVHRRDVIPVDQAIAHFSAVIKREPRSARAYRMRGLAYYDAQEYRRAVHDATAATRLEPNLAPAYVDRGHAKLERLDFRGRWPMPTRRSDSTPNRRVPISFEATSGRSSGSTSRPSRITMRPSDSTPTTAFSGSAGHNAGASEETMIGRSPTPARPSDSSRP